jgi:hypothetical protein
MPSRTGPRFRFCPSGRQQGTCMLWLQEARHGRLRDPHDRSLRSWDSIERNRIFARLSFPVQHSHLHLHVGLNKPRREMAGPAERVRSRCQVGVPPRQRNSKNHNDIGRPMNCKHGNCARQARSRGWCTTHYRRWRSGQDMDGPVRGYVRCQEGADGGCEPIRMKTTRPKRERAFAAEYQLLRELGLRPE